MLLENGIGIRAGRSEIVRLGFSNTSLEPPEVSVARAGNIDDEGAGVTDL